MKIKEPATGLATVVGNKSSTGSPSEMLCYFRTMGSHLFFNGWNDSATGYSFGLVTHLGVKTMVLILPNPEVIARLVDSGALRGTIKYDSSHKLSAVTLDGLDEQECARLFAGKDGECFLWENPFVLVRVSAP